MHPMAFIVHHLGTEKLTLDAVHLAVANGHVHANAAHVNCLISIFPLTLQLLDPTQMHDAMPLPLFLLACWPTNGAPQLCL